MRRTALIAFVVVLGLFGVFIALPYLSDERDLFAAGVPSPPPLQFTSIDQVPGHGRACMTDLALTPQSEKMQFQVGTFRKRGPALTVTINAPGYSSRSRVPAGFEDNAILELGIKPPPSSRLVTLCIRNDGKRKVALYASADRAKSRVNVFVNGKQVEATPWLIFGEAEPRTIWQRLPLTFDRVAIFRGFLGHPWLVWTLALLFAIAMPVLMGAGLAAAFGRDADR
jgi:hypothetical protein